MSSPFGFLTCRLIVIIAFYCMHDTLVAPPNYRDHCRRCKFILRAIIEVKKIFLSVKTTSIGLIHKPPRFNQNAALRLYFQVL